VYKQIADGPQQVRKLIQALSAEIQATKKAAKAQAAREERDRRRQQEEGDEEEDEGWAQGDEDGSREKREEKEKDDQEDWVQCDQCLKWRRLPKRSHPNYPEDLPESWNCSMNNWDKNSSCSKPEESFTVKELSAGAVKIRIWARRLKAADKYEKTFSRSKGNGNNGAIVNGGSVDRDFGDVDWIRCSNPTCGKWRACLRTMDARLVKEANPTWYCWMNSWDDTRSSCSAPQEGTAVRSLVSRKEWQTGVVSKSGDSTPTSKDKDGTNKAPPETPRRVAKTYSSDVGIYADNGFEQVNDDWDGDEEEPFDDEDGEKSEGGRSNGSKGKSSSTSVQSDTSQPPVTLKSISSKGRIVRSRWNTREAVQGRR